MTQVRRVPQGFEPLLRTSPFLDSVGSFYLRGSGAELRLGVFVEERACNARGRAHGGFLAALADVTLGHALASSEAPSAHLVTTSLSIDFAGSVALGDWLESRVELQRLGRQLGFANAYLQVHGKNVVRASGVFVRLPAAAS